ncbi:MAG: hypothetical protein K6F79_10745 [Saccharofermentans sp.]|nr:hypothetical protein [Saccharofermentans sp.]
MNKKQRQYRRAVANGEVFTPKRKPAMPSPKVIELKTRYRRVKRVDPDNEE